MIPMYGVDAKKILPTLIYPTEVMDGAIVSGNCVSACDKNTTYHHQNSPVIHDLLACHGRDINFVGVVITNENVTSPTRSALQLCLEARGDAWGRRGNRV